MDVLSEQSHGVEATNARDSSVYSGDTTISDDSASLEIAKALEAEEILASAKTRRQRAEVEEMVGAAHVLVGMRGDKK